MKLTANKLSTLLEGYPYPSFERMMHDFNKEFPDGLEVDEEVIAENLGELLSTLRNLMQSILYHNSGENQESVKERDEKVKEQHGRMIALEKKQYAERNKLGEDIEIEERKIEAQRWYRYLKEVMG